MKKHLLGLTVLGAFGLAGCGGDGPAKPTESPSPIGVRLTKVVFETSDSDGDGYTIPLPNDLLFSNADCASTPRGPSCDLTLNIPGVSDADLFDSTNGTRRGQAALSKLDGWSAVAPFVVKTKFSKVLPTDPDVTLDTATIAAGVKIYEVTLNRPDVDPSPERTILAPSGAVTDIVRTLEQGVDYSAGLATEEVPAGHVIRISPLKPLSPQSSYMVVFTDDLKDSNGNGVIPDSTYGVVKNTTPLPELKPDGTSNADAVALQKQVNSQEAALERAGVARNKVALSFVFTVASSQETMVAARSWINAAFTPTSAFAVIAPQNQPNGSGGFVFGAAGAAPGAQFSIIYGGQVTVPYFLPPPTTALNGAGLSNDAGAVNGFWQAGTPAGDASPLGPNLSYANPLPRQLATETIPVLVSLPSPALPDCAKPYPVVIFQHGITRNRSDALGITATFASNCIATVAIDQPLHGLDSTSGLFVGYSPSDANGPLRERTFGIDLQNNTSGALFTPDGVADTSGAWTINLFSLLSTRDHVRQAVTDLFALHKALATMDIDGGGADFDTSKVYFVGQSLGSIVGSTFAAYESNVKVAVLSVPGGGLAKLLDGSFAFGPRIRAGLAGGGVTAGTPGYESFLWLAQTVVDSGDPINHAAVGAARGQTLPTLVHEVVGGLPLGPINSPPDLVVPNATIAGTYPNPVYPTGHPLAGPYTVYVTGPLAGTEPLIANLGLTAVGHTDLEVDGGARAVVRFTAGAHGSLLAPDASLDPTGTVTGEMQLQTVRFLKSGGETVDVTNTAIIRP